MLSSVKHHSSADVASYFALLCDDVVKEGYSKLTIILDKNSTHKKKMKDKLGKLLVDLKISDK
ncbi:MAG: hypothetical protein GDA56_15025 [Hormoscilla sp. GM7CHS1pb]|nr:hypothetical protein [Hormoscilla sp. GM7CHS1pb]